MFLAGIQDERASGYPTKAFGYDKSRYAQIPNRTMLVWNKNKVIVTCVQFKMNGSICKNEPANHDKYMADNTAINQVTGGVPVRVIQNWMDRPIEVVSSKGGTLVVVNPFDNLV